MVSVDRSALAVCCGFVMLLLVAPAALGQAAPASADNSSPSLLTLTRDEAFRPTAPVRPAPPPTVMLAQDAPEAADAAVVEEAAIEKPFSIGLDYTIVSDYIFRGINFSEHATEGREKLNHQVNVDLSVDLEALGLGPIGSIGFTTWVEWYADQKKLTGDGANVQEIDYTVSWAYTIEPISTDFAIGWTHYSFPNANAAKSNEWWFSLEHNDAWMWKWLFPDNEDGVLNPSFFFAHDFEAAKGVWMEFAISHGFVCPECPYFTFTPGLKLGVDAGYLGPVTGLDGHDTRLAFLEYSLTIDYALSEALGLPDELGDLTLSGFLNFSDAFAENGSARVIQDEFYGGFGIGWSW